MLQGLAGATAGVFGPAMAALTLSCTSDSKDTSSSFSLRIGRNEMWNHFGNGGAALLSGLFSIVWKNGGVVCVEATETWEIVIACVCDCI